MVIQAKWVETVDVWLFNEIVGKVNILGHKTRGFINASVSRDLNSERSVTPGQPGQEK